MVRLIDKRAFRRLCIALLDVTLRLSPFMASRREGESSREPGSSPCVHGVEHVPSTSHSVAGVQQGSVRILSSEPDKASTKRTLSIKRRK